MLLPRHVPDLITAKSGNHNQESYIPDYMIRRPLFTAQYLDIDSLVTYRNSETGMAQGKERYIERLKMYLDKNETNSIFVQDIETLIRYAENDEHLDMLDHLIEVFMSSEDLRSFGPERHSKSIAKLYYILGQTNRAHKNVLDTDRFGTFFNSQFVFKVVMTMLFDAGLYEDAAKLYDVAIQRLEEGRYQKNTLVTLALASYAKINTPEAFADARKVLDSNNKNGRSVTIRQALYMSHIALNNNDPRYALNLISITSTGSPTLFPNKALALINLQRFDDLKESIYSLLDIASNRSDSLRPMSRDIITHINNCLRDIEDEALRQDIQDALNSLSEKVKLCDESLEKTVFVPLDDRQLTKRRFDRQSNHNRQHYADEVDETEDRLYTRPKRGQMFQDRQETILPTRSFRRRTDTRRDNQRQYRESRQNDDE